jgi:hypothetical protein
MNVKPVLDLLAEDPEGGFTQFGNTLDSMYAELDLTHRMLQEQALDATIDQYDGTPRVYGFNEIRNALLQSLLIGVPRLATDTHPTTCSLVNLKNALDFVPLHRVCLERFTRERPMQFEKNLKFSEEDLLAMEENYRKARKREQEAVFHQNYQAFRKECETLKASAILAKIKKARNKVFAHAEFSRPKSGEPPERVSLGRIGLKWSDLSDALDALRPALYRGILLTTSTGYDMEGLERINTKIAKDFWGSDSVTSSRRQPGS